MIYSYLFKVFFENNTGYRTSCSQKPKFNKFFCSIKFRDKQISLNKLTYIMKTAFKT